MKILTNIGTDNTTSSWTAPSQLTTIVDGTNPNFIRIIQLSNNGVKVCRPGYAVGVSIAVLTAAAAAVEPHLTWPPIITVQPVNRSIVAPNGTTFGLTATSEITATYQWQKSTDGGAHYSNLSNTGVYTNVTTATMSISDVTGLNTNKFRCVVTNGAGSTTSSAGTLTVL